MKKIINIYKLLLPYLWDSKKARFATFLTLLLIGIDIGVTTYSPYIWKNLISTEVHFKPATWFLWNTILLFVLLFFIKNLRNLREISFFPVTNQAIKEIRLKTIFKTHLVSLKQLEKYTVQEIISATSRISQSVRGFMRVSFISIFPSTAKIISLSIALFTADKLCFGIIAASYMGLIVASFCLKYYTHAKYKAWYLTDHVTAAMGQNLYNTATIRFNPEPYNLQLKSLFNLEANAWQVFNVVSYLLYLIQDFIFYLGAGIVFCLLVIGYSQGTVELAKIVLVYSLIISIRSPLTEIVQNFTRFFGGIIDINKTLDILNLPAEKKPLQLTNFDLQSIELEQISFSHTSAKKLLDGVDLIIKPGDKIGIFGPSGAGKSTLCQLIAGLIEPNSGSAMYGNLPISQISPVSLGKVLSYIPQLHLMQELVAEAHEYGLKLKKQAFSGGEYQRHLLEEALKAKPQIIILDETVNSLDEPSAKQILADILEKVPTVVMVSHSRVLLNKMERIFELKRGHLIEVNSN
ncbi:MAG: hypothetical protein BGO68_01400 [Candidatus Amoebophilus sp. 36-38]|nr:MAG: hypothetical protein BGO68_01400 [Candidatus Amoebophilus sp. 36-38]